MSAPQAQLLVLSNRTSLGNLTFQIGDTEMLRIEPDGSFFVKGAKVTTDLEVYEGLADWLRQARATRQEPCPYCGGTGETSGARP